jgi:hypothetical protein
MIGKWADYTPQPARPWEAKTPQNLDVVGTAPYTSAVPWMDVFESPIGRPR